MRKTTQSLTAIALAAVMLSGCGGNSVQSGADGRMEKHRNTAFGDRILPAACA